MFNFFKKSPKLTSWEKPLLMTYSEIPGFDQFICSPNTNDQFSFIRLIKESDIPINQTYFKYIGNGKCIKIIKFDDTKISKFEENLSPGLRKRVFEFENQISDFSNTYNKSDLISMCFWARKNKEY